MKKVRKPDNQIAFYQAPDGAVNIEVLYAEENIWLTQKRMAELFDTTTQNITQHLKIVYAGNELEKIATCKDFLQVQKEGERKVKRNLTFYSLEAIIAVGYRVNSDKKLPISTPPLLIIRRKRSRASSSLPLSKINCILL